MDTRTQIDSRFEVIINSDTIIPGAVFVGVNQVGSAFSPFRAVIMPDGTVVILRSDDPPAEAIDAINKAREKAIFIANRKAKK